MGGGKFLLCDTQRKFHNLGLEHAIALHLDIRALFILNCSIIFLKRNGKALYMFSKFLNRSITNSGSAS
jgi:hypothetical protein